MTKYREANLLLAPVHQRGGVIPAGGYPPAVMHTALPHLLPELNSDIGVHLANYLDVFEIPCGNDLDVYHDHS